MLTIAGYVFMTPVLALSRPCAEAAALKRLALSCLASGITDTNYRPTAMSYGFNCVFMAEWRPRQVCSYVIYAVFRQI
jgi:hypothetical protein